MKLHLLINQDIYCKNHPAKDGKNLWIETFTNKSLHDRPKFICQNSFIPIMASVSTCVINYGLEC